MDPKYDLDEIIDRRGTSCLKYDFAMQNKGRDDLLPLWVADMDFKVPDEITEALHARLDHAIYGYTDPDQAYYDAINAWFSKHHGYTVEPEWVTVGCGKIFGPETAQFERFNIACPRSVLKKALTQLKNALDAHEKW